MYHIQLEDYITIIYFEIFSILCHLYRKGYIIISNALKITGPFYEFYRHCTCSKLYVINAVH